MTLLERAGGALVGGAELAVETAGDGATQREAISLCGVSRVFGRGASRIVALDGVDLSVQRGEIVSLLGASGCGKSTLLGILAGLDQPTSGTATVPAPYQLSSTMVASSAAMLSAVVSPSAEALQ